MRLRMIGLRQSEEKKPVKLIDNYDKIGHALNIRTYYGGSVFDIERVATCSLCGHTFKLRELYYNKQPRCPFCACKIEL